MIDETCDNEVTPESAGLSTDDPLPSDRILKLDYLFEALCHRRRRYLCCTLSEDTEWSLLELATKIAAWERDLPESAVTDHQKTQVYVDLYHAHVPKLVDEGVITFDATTERITPTENARPVLQALQGIGRTLDADREAHARGDMVDQEDP